MSLIVLSFHSGNESPMGGSVPEYLLYCFEGPKLIKCDTFFAPDDEAAVEGALTRHDGAAAELWSGSRKVKVFEESKQR